MNLDRKTNDIVTAQPELEHAPLSKEECSVFSKEDQCNDRKTEFVYVIVDDKKCELDRKTKNLGIP